ncbi:MAG: ABC transporter ATP-binding protein [Opitutus sp.]|nr:ABC transporter ATP-binding protein [Opitutus sp.]MCS6248096.1 ABC transporter ATP-binding protein [Opitutus sp.]MCS6274719.1 ABC transporter ATP-binding protein [Opitutus sp.]MCS6278028.1 ABC transporter ATP-binding protein [Opitutus sp.]MCS6298864.1 ABC transporter ATP-binding protein [Opitutus sp.]
MSLPESASTSSPFRRHLWPLILKNRGQLLWASLFVGLSGGAVATQNIFPKWLFFYVLDVKDLATAERWKRLAWLAAGYLVLTGIARMAFWHFGYRLFTRARENIIFALRAKFFRHVNQLCLRFHGTHSSGELFSYLFGSPLNAIMQFAQHATMALPSAIVFVLLTIALFWQWDGALAAVLMTAASLSVYMMLRSRRSVELIQKEFQALEGNISGQVADLLRGNKAVKLYAMETQVVHNFEQQADVIGRKTYERDILSHQEWMKQEALSYVCYAGLMAACTWRYLSGHIDLGIVAACLAAYLGLMGPLQQLFTAFTLWAGAAAALTRIGNVLDTASTTPDPDHATRSLPARADIVLDHVTFGYDPAQPILRDLSLTLRPGERVAFVGPSGAGKTTITQLLLRLYDPQAGAIRIGEIDLKTVAGSALRRHFGVVPQDPFIFNTTLRDNLRVARPDATDEAIRLACEKSNAWEFIAALPGGLDARVGEGGSMLSGGQRQRLAIARALLAEPECFIFDEATSALDTLSEQLISQALEHNLGDRTAVFIAHRLSTVKHCDRIFVLSGGALIQSGTYDELVATEGLFQDLVRGQQLRA